MALTIKLSKSDAETLRLSLQAIVAVSTSTEGIGLRFATLAGWSTTVEADYLAAVNRIAAFIETAERALDGTDA